VRPRTALQLSRPLEEEEARTFYQWCRVTQRWLDRPLSDYLVLMPNGAHLAGDAKRRAQQVAKLKLAGLRVGASDYFLAIPIGGRSGLWIELKRRSGRRASPEQIDFQELMLQAGYARVISPGWEHAANAVRNYLERGEP
jgi:hypothetical protein